MEVLVFAAKCALVVLTVCATAVIAILAAAVYKITVMSSEWQIKKQEEREDGQA